ncbi:NYN domain-containing protein [Roseovarius sp. ZX-A-9]|uniref:NYN domain-containing protein n=1 Tax=Roseovarius sp. ZX-A-9 TaxID=3014783 RepID=UPI00232FB7C4|nr:hypothetical protein [Roseovarius sp. ZX-A-9]
MSVTPEMIAGGVCALLALAILIVLRRILRKPHHRIRRNPRRWIVVDGSNVMFWDGNEPKAETLRRVVGYLAEQGFTAVVWFDANVGYKLSERYRGSDWLARQLGIPESRVLVAVKGQPADPLVLDGARQLGARVVTNDRFRDWVDEFPEIVEPGHLVQGRLQNGQVQLEL